MDVRSVRQASVTHNRKKKSGCQPVIVWRQQNILPLAERIFSHCRHRSLQTPPRSALLNPALSEPSHLIQDRDTSVTEYVQEALFWVMAQFFIKYNSPTTNALELRASTSKMPLVLLLNLSHRPRPNRAKPTTCQTRSKTTVWACSSYMVSHRQIFKSIHPNDICNLKKVVRPGVSFSTEVENESSRTEIPGGMLFPLPTATEKISLREQTAEWDQLWDS